MSTFTGPKGEIRLRNTDWVVPVVIGTVAFYLGKKATEYNSHRWTLYLRGGNNEDLSYFIKKVAFTLHPSFENHVRVVETPPYELTESGWGEFEISATITFSDDAMEDDIELFHKLRLYADDTQSVQNTKKPVVTEQYEELVFSEPTEAFYSRVSAQQPSPGAPYSQAAYFTKFNPQDDLRAIYSARQSVKQMHNSVEMELDSYM